MQRPENIYIVGFLLGKVQQDRVDQDHSPCSNGARAGAGQALAAHGQAVVIEDTSTGTGSVVLTADTGAMVVMACTRQEEPASRLSAHTTRLPSHW